jgi:hypothetical protein
MKARWWLVAVLALGPAAPVRADAFPHFGPRHRPSSPTPVHPANAVPVAIEASDTLTEPRLVIPRALLARAKKLPAVRPTAALQGESRRAGASGGAVTALAGLALTAALSAGGLCLARRKGRALVVLLVVGVACAFGAGRAFVGAHPPPPNWPPPPAEILFDRAAVEVVERGTEVRLLVPRARLGELARNLR